MKPFQESPDTEVTGAPRQVLDVFKYQMTYRCKLGNIYRVILKKVPFGNVNTIMVSEEEINFTMESKAKVLSLSKFS